mgnify:CR=1 FL=1
MSTYRYRVQGVNGNTHVVVRAGAAIDTALVAELEARARERGRDRDHSTAKAPL